MLETDPRVADALEQLAPSYGEDDGDWDAVRRRARRPRPRAVLVAVAAAAALLVTPPLGLGGRLLDLIEGPPAPPEVRTSFADNDVARQKLMAYAEAAGQQLHDRFSPVLPDEARGVAAIESPDGPIYLWAAPTEDGRQCWLIQAGAEAATGRPYGSGACDDESGAAIVPDLLWTAERPSVQTVHVRVHDDAVTRVEVFLAGATPVSLRVVSGHALGTVPKDAQVEEYVGRNADGEAVARVALAEDGTARP